MLTFKIVIFIVIAVIILISLTKNLNDWSISFRNYMLKGSKEFYGKGGNWEGADALFVSKVVVFFFGLMIIVGVYVLIFSVTHS